MSYPQSTTNLYLERLIDIRRKDKKTFDGLSPALRYSVAEYEAGKRQSQQDAEAANGSKFPSDTKRSRP